MLIADGFSKQINAVYKQFSSLYDSALFKNVSLF